MNILEIGLQKGIEQGIEKGKEQGMEFGVKAFIEICGELGLSKEETLSKEIEKFSIDGEAAERYMEMYWKEKV